MEVIESPQTSHSELIDDEWGAFLFWDNMDASVQELVKEQICEILTVFQRPVVMAAIDYLLKNPEMLET